MPRPRHQGRLQRRRPRPRRLRRGRRRGRRPARARRRRSPTSRATTCCRGSSELVAAGVDLAHFDTGEPLGDTSRFITANAYLGCWGIVEALRPRRRHRRHRPRHRRRGRVRPGGVAPRLGSATTGTRSPARSSPATSSSAARRRPAATTRSSPRCPAWPELGFPWAEVAADGSSVIGKHDGTGGQVSIGTVTSQLLYEIGGPAYLGPDVTARFDTIELEQVGARPGPHLRDAGRAAAADAEGGDERARRLPQRPRRRAHRPRHRGQGRSSSRPRSGQPARTRPDDFASVTTTRRPHRQGRPGHERGGGRASGGSPSRTPTSARSAGPSSNAMIELALATIPGFFGVERRTERGPPVRRLPAGARAGRARAAARRRARRRPDGRRVGVAGQRRRRRRRRTGRRARPPRRPAATTDARAARPGRRRPVRRQGRQRQPRRVRPHRRGVGVARRRSSRPSACGPAARDRGARGRAVPLALRCGR